MSPVEVSIARLEEKFDALAASLAEDRKETAKRLDDYELRIRKNERTIYLVCGAAAALGLGGGTLTSALLGS